MEILNNDIIEKFWKNVDKSDSCWIWNSRTNSKSKYGVFRFRIKNKRFEFLAHKVAYFLDKKVDQRIFHKCKNTLCINPIHLSHNKLHQPVVQEVEVIKGVKHISGPHIIKW